MRLVSLRILSYNANLRMNHGISLACSDCPCAQCCCEDGFDDDFSGSHVNSLAYCRVIPWIVLLSDSLDLRTFLCSCVRLPTVDPIQVSGHFLRRRQYLEAKVLIGVLTTKTLPEFPEEDPGISIPPPSVRCIRLDEHCRNAAGTMPPGPCRRKTARRYSTGCISNKFQEGQLTTRIEMPLPSPQRPRRVHSERERARRPRRRESRPRALRRPPGARTRQPWPHGPCLSGPSDPARLPRLRRGAAGS